MQQLTLWYWVWRMSEYSKKNSYVDDCIYDFDSGITNASSGDYFEPIGVILRENEHSETQTCGFISHPMHANNDNRFRPGQCTPILQILFGAHYVYLLVHVQPQVGPIGNWSFCRTSADVDVKPQETDLSLISPVIGELPQLQIAGPIRLAHGQPWCVCWGIDRGLSYLLAQTISMNLIWNESVACMLPRPHDAGRTNRHTNMLPDELIETIPNPHFLLRVARIRRISWMYIDYTIQ